MWLTEGAHYEKEDIHTWDKLLSLYHKRFSKPREAWIFRGHKEASWGLQTTLELEIARLKVEKKKFKKEPGKYKQELSRVLRNKIYSSDGGEKTIFELEAGLLREFKRKCHHYEMDTPKKEDIAEWLALMRHYGAPSRLLDWTYSFFVAVFFAIEEAEQDCAVWALGDHWVHKLVESKLNKDGHTQLANALKEVDKITEQETFKKFFWKGPSEAISFVYPLTPFRLNQRLTVQQGLFLCPGDVSKPFEENLISILPEGSCIRQFLKLDIKFSRKERTTALQHLHRMNISRASLFPGLDGFAQSLRTLLVFPKLLKPEKEV